MMLPVFGLRIRMQTPRRTFQHLSRFCPALSAPSVRFERRSYRGMLLRPRLRIRERPIELRRLFG
jgi:hypothetical protein